MKFFFLQFFILFLFLLKRNMAMSYADLEIYKEGLGLYIDIHKLTLNLPKFELYELGSQLRRSADSVVSNIVEGYGRRRYKAEFIRFLVFSHASNLEVSCHLEKVMILYPHLNITVFEMIERNDQLSRKLYKFLEFVETSWKV